MSGNQIENGLEGVASRTELAGGAIPISITVRASDGSVVPRAEIVTLPWNADWEARLRRPHAIDHRDLAPFATWHTTDETGKLDLSRPAARFAVGARASGFAAASMLVDEQTVHVEIRLDAGHTLRLHALDHANQRVSDVSFEVHIDPRSMLERYPNADPAQLAILPFFRSQGTTLADAIATIDHLAAGSYRVRARHSQYAESTAWGAWVPMESDAFVLSLEPKAYVDGIVRRKQDGAPVSGARVEIRHLVNGNYFGDSCATTTDETGSFVCDNAWGSPFGDLEGRAMCWREGYAVQSIAYGFPKPGERTHLEFSLEESHPFHGLVEDSTGGPRGGVMIMVSEDHVTLETTTTRPDGTFTIHGLAKDAEVYFYASGPGVSPAYVTAPSPWPTEWPFVIRVEPTHTLEGRLIVDGYPLEGARVRAALESNRVSRLQETWVDADPKTGHFRFDHLHPGRYYFDTIAKGYSPTRVREIEVGEKSENLPLEIRLEKGCRVRGVVRSSANGAPIEGAKVGIADFGELIREKCYGIIDLGVTTDLEGRFEIASVDPGREIVLAIEKDGHARFLDRFVISTGATLVERSIELLGAGRLVVSVIRPDGQPAGDFSVIAVDSSGSEHRGAGAARTTIAGLSPTPHRVTVTLQDGIDDFRGATRVFDDVRIREGEETVLHATFADGLAIRGRILGDVARGYTGGFGAFAFLWKNGRWDSNEFCEVRRNDLGFSIFGLEPGTYKVQVESIDRQPMLATARIVELTADSPCSLDFEFGDFVLEGTVTDNTRRPVVGASLALSAEEITNDGVAGDSNSAAVATATSASDGRYAVAGLSPGPYRVRIDAEGFARLGSRIIVEDREPTARHDFALEPECRLRVSVVDRGGHGIVARAVTVRDTDSSHSGDEYDASAVDSDGLTIVRGAGTGRYALAVTAPGFFPHRSTIACVAGAPIDVRVTMRRLAGLRLVARDALGAPLKHASLSITDLDTGEDVSAWIADGLLSASPDATSTDESGTLRIDGIPEGRYRVLGFGIDGEVETSFDPDPKPTTLAAIR